MDSNEKIYDVCIVGAGFSGLVLAIKLARAGLLVCLVELNRVVGRRILSTGNGRCNFTNSQMGKEFYYSNHDLSFITDVHADLTAFLRDLGVIEREFEGYYYPITNQAKTAQFIVVSLRKPMLDNADRMIGVTQKDKCVTKISGIKLKDE